MKDYYKILGIQRTATNEEIKKAFRAAALFWHPDKNGNSNAHEKFIEITEAYNILIEPEKRKVYDNLCEVTFLRKSEPQGVPFNYKEKVDFSRFEEWVKEARAVGERLLNVSIDDFLTNSFHLMDKYGRLVLFAIFIIVILLTLAFGGR